MTFNVVATDQHTNRSGVFTLTITSDAAGTLILPTDALGRQSQIQQGYNFQSTIGVTVDFTLAAPHDAQHNPSSVPWDNVGIANATILEAQGKSPTAIRFTFAGAGVLYVNCM